MYRYLWRDTIIILNSQYQSTMKSAIACMLILLLFSACNDTQKLSFESMRINEQACTDCPQIHIDIPKVLENSKIAKSVNSALKEELISLLIFDDEIAVNTIEEAMTSFTKGYDDMKTLFADESASWEAKINAKPVFEDASFLTIELNCYMFTGGAHGYTSVRYLNFDKTKGTELENWELFSSTEKFEEFAEVKFREQESIPTGASINHTGLMFERDDFYLPENIGFTKDGVELLYNPYEGASYADGPIILNIPFKEVRPYLVSKVNPKQL